MYQREDDFWWHSGMKEIVNTLLNKYFNKSKVNKILDVGCGTGGMFKILSGFGQIWGIDKSSEAVRYARERNIAQSVEQREIDRLPYDDNSFDLVVCFDVLYHRWVKNDISVIQEMRRVLKKNGILLIREPAYNWLRSQHDSAVWTNHRFSLKELKNKLESADFKVEKISYTIFFLFPLVLAKRLLENVYKSKDTIDHTFEYSWVGDMLFKPFLILESKLINLLNFPFGLSIIGVSKK